MQWEQVDFDEGLIALAETKSGRPQTVVMNAPARQVLKELEQVQASEWVQPSTTNAKRPIPKGSVEAAWARIRAAANLQDVRLHDLRHTVGTYAGQTGANSFLVRDLLQRKLTETDSEPWCGLQVIDLDTGACVHWFRLDGPVAELYDVGVIRGVVRPMALGFASNEIMSFTTCDEPEDLSLPAKRRR